jgi:hypothetical protein
VLVVSEVDSVFVSVEELGGVGFADCEGSGLAVSGSPLGVVEGGGGVGELLCVGGAVGVLVPFGGVDAGGVAAGRVVSGTASGGGTRVSSFCSQ